LSTILSRLVLSRPAKSWKGHKFDLRGFLLVSRISLINKLGKEMAEGGGKGAKKSIVEWNFSFSG
jgi:hypothetical protein